MKSGLHFIVLITILLMVFSCSRTPTGTSQNNEFRILPFTGVRIENGSEFDYVLTARWLTREEDDQVAVRVRTTDGVQPEGIETDADGWILFGESIWTAEKAINFTFTSSEGTLDHIILEIDVQNEDGSILTRSIFDDRLLGTNLFCEQGDIDGMDTGTALDLILSEQTDIFVDGMYAHHFMYRLIKLDENGEEISASDWYSTLYCTDIRRISLTSETEPALSPDGEGCSTRIEAYVVTRNGISDEANPASLEFHVIEGMHPATLIYSYMTFALGENHFSRLEDNMLFNPSIDYPVEMTEDGYNYAMHFFIDSNGEYGALWSEDFKLYLNVGYAGEYYCNNPSAEYMGEVYNEETGLNYFASIEYYDISINGEDLTQYGIEAPIVTDDGVSYSRISYDPSLDFDVILQNLPASVQGSPHQLIVRAIDNQGNVDPTPAILLFNLFEPVPHEDKTGVVVIDDDIDNTFSPDDSVDPLYTNGFLQADLELDYNDLKNSVWDSQLNYSRTVLSATDLQHYKFMVWHVDNPPRSVKYNLALEIDNLNLIMPQKTNLLLSGGANLWNAYSRSCQSDFHIFDRWLGLQETSDEAAVGYMAGSAIEFPWFIGAESQVDEYPDIDFDPEQLWGYLPSLFVPRGGMGSIAYFPEDYHTDGAEVIYRFICKEPGTDNYSPSQEEYDLLNGQPVALRVVHDGFTTWMFGFPLSWMPQDTVTQLLDQIQLELQ